VAYTRALFNRYCVPLSGVVFNQEGQSGEGKHAFMAEHGYTISVFPKNLLNYYQGDGVRWPLYTNHGVDVVVGPTDVATETGLSVNWTYFDDGEILALGGTLDPYFAPMQPEPKWDHLSEYETSLSDLESEGYKIATITDYVAHLKALGWRHEQRRIAGFQVRAMDGKSATQYAEPVQVGDGPGVRGFEAVREARRRVCGNVIDQREGFRAADLDFAHVADVEHAHRFAHRHVLRENPGVLNGHIPPAKIDHFGAQRSMDRIERCTAQGRGLRHANSG